MAQGSRERPVTWTRELSILSRLQVARSDRCHIRCQLSSVELKVLYCSILGVPLKGTIRVPLRHV